MSVFIRAINAWYEKAKVATRSRSFVTADILKTVYERLYNEKPEEEKEALYDVIAEYVNDAWWYGVRSSGKVFDIPLAEKQIYPNISIAGILITMADMRIDYARDIEYTPDSGACAVYRNLAKELTVDEG